jgi:hypothetical protein
VTTKLKEIWLVLRRGRFFLEGLVVCSLGGESWDKEEEWKIGEERVGRVVIYSLLPMASPTEYLCRWFHRQVWRWIGHVTIWRSRFESLSDSVGKIACKKFHVSEPLFFFNSEYSVYNSVSICRLNYRRNSVRR